MSQPRTVEATKIGKENIEQHVQLTILTSDYIGSGVFSNVYKATLENPKIVVAIKKSWPEPESKIRQKEIHLLLFGHPHIVSMLYFFTSKNVNHETACWNMVLDYLPSCVRKVEEDHENKDTRVSKFDIKLWTYQLFCGLEYMHSKNICHRDIKPDNMLLDVDTGLLKLGDLGSAKIIKENEQSDPYQVTRYYRAPELILKYRNYSFKIDDWAAGCVLGGLALGQVLFAGDDNNDQLMRIMKVLGSPSEQQVNAMHPPQCPQRDWPQKMPRKEWSKVFDRQDTAMFDLLDNVLEYDPNKRFLAGQACAHHYYDELRKPETRMPNGKPLPISPENLDKHRPQGKELSRNHQLRIRNMAMISARDHHTAATQSVDDDTAVEELASKAASVQQRPKRKMASNRTAKPAPPVESKKKKMRTISRKGIRTKKDRSRKKKSDTKSKK